MIKGLFEILMLLCFASAWPFSIYKQWKTGKSTGKSIIFSYIVLAGYSFGILNKLVNDEVNYILFFYVLDFCLVTLDMALYYRNLKSSDL